MVIFQLANCKRLPEGIQDRPFAVLTLVVASFQLEFLLPKGDVQHEKMRQILGETILFPEEIGVS